MKNTNEENESVVETIEPSEQVQEDDSIIVQTLETDLAELESITDVDTPPDETPPEEKPKVEVKKSRSQKRIREQAKRIKELEYEVSMANENKTPEPTNDMDMPNIDHFSTYAEYDAQLEIYEEQLKIKREQEFSIPTSKEEQVFDSLSLLLDDAKDKYDDFEEVTSNEELVITFDLMDSLTNFEDNAGELLYILANNPDLSKELSNLTPAKQYKRLVLLENDLENGVVRQAKKVKGSNAPEPISPVSGSQHNIKTIDDDDVTQAEMDSFVNKQSAVTRGGWL